MTATSSSTAYAYRAARTPSPTRWDSDTPTRRASSSKTTTPSDTSFDLKLNARVSDALHVSGTFQGNLRTFNEVGYTTGTVLNTIMRGLPIFSDYHRNGIYGSTWLFTPGRNNIENPRMEVEQGFRLPQLSGACCQP